MRSDTPEYGDRVTVFDRATGMDLMATFIARHGGRWIVEARVRGKLTLLYTEPEAEPNTVTVCLRSWSTSNPDARIHLLIPGAKHGDSHPA